MLTVHSLTLDHVAGVEHAHLELPDHGVVVVHGPNEMGKSTLLAAFGLLLADVPVSSKARQVRDLKSVTADEATTISADLTVAGYRLTVLKAFNKGSGRCELTVRAPRSESLTGRQAAERFAAILAEGLDTTLLDALTIEQGASLDLLAASGIRTLEQALGEEAETTDAAAVADASVGQVRDTDAADAVIARIRAEYERYFTPGGKPSKELAAAEKARDEAVADHEAARSAYAKAQDLITEMEQLVAEKAKVVARQPAAEDDAAAAQAELAAGRAAAEKLGHVDRAVAAAQREVDLAEQRMRVREERVRDVAEAEESVAARSRAVEETAQQADREKEQAVQLRTRITAARREARLATAWVGFVTARTTSQDADKECVDLRERLHKAGEADTEVRDLTDLLNRNPATESAMRDLGTADTAYRQAVSVRDAAATVVDVDGPVDGQITIDGARDDLEDGHARIRVAARRTIGLGDYTVTVTPARDVSELEDDVVRAAAERNRCLGILGVSDTAHADALAEHRKLAEGTLAEARLRFARITAGSPLTELSARLESATTQQRQARERMAEALTRIRTEDPEGSVDLPGVPTVTTDDSVETLEGAVTATSAELDAVAEDATRGVEELQEDLDRTVRSGAAVRLDVQKAELERAEATRLRLSSALATERESDPDEVLRAALEDRGRELAEAEKHRVEAAASVGEIDVDMLERLADGAVAKVRRLREREVETDKALSRANGALGEHSGVAERLDEADAARERAERSYRRVRRQADAAELLHIEVQAALTRARERYEAPFRAAVERLARNLYGAPVQFEFDGELGVSRRNLDGVTLDIDRLSGGAREQLAVLSRLAVAELVGGGESVPVIIDDALGFSDQGRIGRMNVVLDDLGNEHQIIVLTCDVDRFDGIAGATFVPMSEVLG